MRGELWIAPSDIFCRRSVFTSEIYGHPTDWKRDLFINVDVLRVGRRNGDDIYTQYVLRSRNRCRPIWRRDWGSCGRCRWSPGWARRATCCWPSWRALRSGWRALCSSWPTPSRPSSSESTGTTETLPQSTHCSTLSTVINPLWWPPYIAKCRHS